MHGMNQRTENVSFRMTPEELNDLKAEAAQEGLKVADVIRRRLFWHPNPPVGTFTPAIESNVTVEDEVVTEVKLPGELKPRGSWAARNSKQAAIDQMLKKPAKEPKG